MAKVALGVDFGGTFVKFISMDENLKTSEIFQLPTEIEKGPEGIVNKIVEGINKLIADENFAIDDIVGVGIGSPGPLSIKTGTLLALPNIPGMENFPLVKKVSERIPLPVTLENDANAAAYAEFLCGMGRGTHDMVMVTLGTGVGSGIVHNGRIVHGAHDTGGEMGHLIVYPGGRQCSCGQKGCLEEYSSAMKMALHAQRELHENQVDSSLQKIVSDVGKITSRDILEAAKAGDEFAAEKWNQCCYYLALGCISVCRLLDPERIVLAGGLSNAGDMLLDNVNKYWDAMDCKLYPRTTELALATVGSAAGAIGAAGVAWANFAPHLLKIEE